MDKKSFIRGFGAGVIFAALILGISCVIRTSDSFVTARARQLGMVYADEGTSENKLADVTSEKEKKASASPEASQAPVSSVVPSDDKNKEKSSDKTAATKEPETKSEVTATKEPEATPKTVATTEPETKKSSKKTTNNKTDMEKEKKKLEKSIREEEKKLTINAGDWSSDVSRKLEDLGVIDSAKDFDMYLDRNGYSSSINAGTYDVSVDDTYKELAQKITRK